MGNGSSSPEETERERVRRTGDMTKAEVLRIKTFFRMLMVYKIEWVHEVSGRVHHNTKLQRLQWSLSKLDLRENRLKYFPPQVKRLKQLRELDLSQNRFKRFPADAFRAPNLEVIKISDNKIRNIRLETLVPSLLSNLVQLHLDNNRIAELPDAFIDFCNLEVLNLSANGFLDFPDLICEMTSLRQLLMEQNSMWFLPQTFNQLESLEVLALNANNFEMMPRVLCDMDRLVDLRLGRNGITSLMRGETIQTHLDNGQVITMVVETFKLMTDLKKLTVAMNELTDLPPDVWDVKLDHLNLRNNEIAGELPIDIVKLQGTLVELYLDENQLTALPACLTDFPHLEYLTVNGNKLKSLPRMPPQLLELHAASNNLVKLPKHLYQPNRREKGYKKLKVLDVRGNRQLNYPPPSYLLRADEIGEYLEKLKEGADNIVLDPVTGLRVVEASRGHVEVDSYGNEIKEESKIDTLKASTKEERLRRTFEAIDEDESGFIERKEFRKLIKRLAPQMSKDEVDEVFNTIDVDGGGDLDFEEFSTWWESPAGRAFRDGQRDWKQQGEKAEAEAEAAAAAAAAAIAEQAGEAGGLGTSKFAAPGHVGDRAGPRAAGEPGSADFVSNWVMSGGAVGTVGGSPAAGHGAEDHFDDGPPEGVDVPHYREYGKLDGRLLAEAKAEKSAPLKYQEKKELMRAQRKAQEGAMGMTHADAMAAAAAARDQMDEGDDGRMVADDEAVVEKTLEQIQAERVAAEEAEAKRIQAERLNAVRERFQKGVRKAAKAAAMEKGGAVVSENTGGQDDKVGMTDLRATEAEDAMRERAKAKEDQAARRAARNISGKSAEKYVATSDDADDTHNHRGNTDARARFRAGVNKVKAANAATAAFRSATSTMHDTDQDESRGGDSKKSKGRKGRGRRSSQERENSGSRHRKKSGSHHKHGGHKNRRRDGMAGVDHENHPFGVQSENDQQFDHAHNPPADDAGLEEIISGSSSSSSSSSSTSSDDDKSPQPVIITGEFVMALP